MSSKRRRRSAAEARRAILESGRQQLAEHGPEGVVLDEIARTVGISRANVLYHFGSRDDLLDALAQQITKETEEELLEVLTRSLGNATAERDVARSAVEAVFELLGKQGLGQVFLWLYRRDPSLAEAHGRQLRLFATLIHSQRSDRPNQSPSYDDVLFAIGLLSFATFGTSLVAPYVAQSAGIDITKFRRWLADTCVGLMGSANRPPSEATKTGGGPLQGDGNSTDS